MSTDSDIKLLVVGLDDQRDEEADKAASLEAVITRWTGNDARAFVMTVSAVDARVETGPLLDDIVLEGHTIADPASWLRRSSVASCLTVRSCLGGRSGTVVRMSTLGIIGSGSIGSAVARLAIRSGIPVVLANSRGPQTLADLVNELGPLASSGTVDEAAAAGDFVVLSVPLTAIEKLDPHLLDGKLVLDTTNYYPFRDGRVTRLDAEEVTCAELVQEHFAGARLVKVFSNIVAPHIPQLARPSMAEDRTALPIAGNDDTAKGEAAALIDQLGFLTIDTGTLADAWRFEPESAAYTPIYLADPTTPAEQLMQAPAGPVSPEHLSSRLESATRVRVADRQF